VRLILEPGSYTLQNCGDVAMLQVAYRRVRHFWPDATVHIVTEAPGRLADLCPGAVPLVAPEDRGALVSPNFVGRLSTVLPSAARISLNAAQSRFAARWPQQTLRLLAAKGQLRTRDEVLATFADALSRAQLVAVTGTGMVTDAFRKRAMAFLTTLRVAIARGAATVMYSQGLGPVEDAELRRYAEPVLSRIDLLSVREGCHSMAFLRELGVPDDRIMITGDDAIELAYELRRPATGDALGINIRVASYAGIDGELMSVVRPVLHEVAARTGAPLLPVPISLRSGADARVIRDLLAGFDDRSDGGASLDTPAKVIKQVSRCRVVVTGSYHAAVFALAQGIPTVALVNSTYYEHKFAGLANQFGDGCVILRPEGDLRERLTSAIDRLWADAEMQRQPLLRAASRQVALSWQAYERTAALLHANRTVAQALRAPKLSDDAI
jgi:polysaccharide pyruvyl transferase WcaK-like protein